MSNLLDSIQDAIREHIPEQVGEELKKRMANLEATEQSHSELTKEHAILRDKYQAALSIQSKLELDIATCNVKEEIIAESAKRMRLRQDDLNFRQSLIELKEMRLLVEEG